MSFHQQLAHSRSNGSLPPLHGFYASGSCQTNKYPLKPASQSNSLLIRESKGSVHSTPLVFMCLETFER